MRKVRFIRASVFRDMRYGDCSNRGISSRFSELLVACPDGPEWFDADIIIPLNFCHICQRHLFGYDVYCIRPASMSNDGIITDRNNRWYSMGGNFAYTCDSRFTNLTPGIYGAIAIHDRIE